MISLDDITVWRTNSEIRWVFAEAETVSAALTQLASALRDFGLDEQVTHLDLQFDDDGTVIAGALTEQLKEAA